jgi:D-alanyl-D-alanine carboxypeptidase (penicillin-binding protein 5/6)
VGADGINTGHAEGPGYSLVSSGMQNGRRIIMVVQGLDSKQSRSDEALELYLWAFRNFDNYKLAKAEASLVAAPVWLGAEETVALGPKTDLVLTLPRDARGQIKATAVFDGPLAAPLAAGQEVGKLHIVAPGMTPVDVPLVTTVAVERLGAFGRMLAAAKYLLRG